MPTGPRRSTSTSPTILTATTSTAATCSSSMWDAAGLSRNGEDLERALATLAQWRAPDATDAKSAEDANLLVVARAVVASALARRESRGGHYRTDFPEQRSRSGPALVDRAAACLSAGRSSASSTWRSTRMPRSATSPRRRSYPSGRGARRPGRTRAGRLRRRRGLRGCDDRRSTRRSRSRSRPPTASGSSRRRARPRRRARACGPAGRAGRTQPRAAHDRHRDAHRTYVAAVAGTRARVVDTRKTTPGLRALERHAVRCGGGHNHRYSLSDAVMAKDNHLAVLAATSPRRCAQAEADLPHTTHIEVEVDRLDQLDAVLAAGRRHDHARQLQPRRPARGRRARSPVGRSSRPAAASPSTRSRRSPDGGRRHLGRRTDPQRARARPRARHHASS